MSSALKEPRNSALAVLILEIDVHVSTSLLLSGRTLVQADYGRRGKLGNSGGIELGVPAESGHQGRPFY